MAEQSARDALARTERAEAETEKLRAESKRATQTVARLQAENDTLQKLLILHNSKQADDTNPIG